MQAAVFSMLRDSCPDDRIVRAADIERGAGSGIGQPPASRSDERSEAAPRWAVFRVCRRLDPALACRAL